MATTTVGLQRTWRRPGKPVLVAAVLLAWVLIWVPARGVHTLGLSPADLTPLHHWLNDVNDTVGANRDSSPFFLYFFNEIRAAVDSLVTFLQDLIAQPSYGRPVPVLGWLGVVAVVAYVSWVFAGWKPALLAAAGFVFFGLQGLWEESMDTLALTLGAVVISLLIGIPLGIWAGLSDRFHKLVTPVLDFMQTMPTFVYLAPLTLLFLIGPASATIATLIYAMPPAIRLTAHGIRSVPRSAVEASESLGATGRQKLTGVLLPLSKGTIVLGVNQTIMAALSMVTIAALIDAPGLGKTVIKALQTLDVGTAFNAGLAIVVMAVVLDRVTTAAGNRVRQTGRAARFRRPLLAVFGVVAAVCAYLSHTYYWAAEFPDDVTIGGTLAKSADSVALWAQQDLSTATEAIKNAITYALLNPLEALLVESPWWLVGAVAVLLAALLGTVRSVITTAACVALLIGTGLWQDSMTTLAMTIVATAMVMLLGVAVGVWMGRNRFADRIIRPVLDAGQTMPAFVYLVPFLALFSATRFTAIVAAVVFAAPVAIKIVADGVRAIPAATAESATAAGSSAWQMITKVQLPMARPSLTLAANQGLIYVLSMVVVGGLVGAGALGYDVVAGFSQGQLYGKGLAAGAAIVLLGIMLDRIARASSPSKGSN
ncbi:ABC transporter permease subunit [Actinoplanes xinjiangensis]|uniref:Glycine betaine/proline transport system permease protein n=1 Tax=Actinoplanes xinjiangensis TaxID=512350 RepID=A0A316F7L1_9ACTN|nr:ABC transporter permease subunit [Actinoplanes xinjiangensis]PWK41283.1 glycine betaine/proline transport system permease protein [Actinoplanes xinjiangensis]GIF42210.1 glycine/betaine ABC transporter permease [Actinoplanes xinjiangensis]